MPRLSPGDRATRVTKPGARSATEWLFSLFVVVIMGLILAPANDWPTVWHSEDSVFLASHIVIFFVLTLVGIVSWGPSLRLIAGVAAFSSGLEVCQFLAPSALRISAISLRDRLI